MLEAKVHSELRDFLREQQQPIWSHHLTMARLVSRALRLHRSALIQTGSTVSCYSYSYLTPALLSDQPLILVAPLTTQTRLLETEIPKLKEWLNSDQEIIQDDGYFSLKDFNGLLLTTPDYWLSDRLKHQDRFSHSLPILIDQGENLPDWTRHFLSLQLTSLDWEELIVNYPIISDQIRQIRVKLTKSLFSHPPNPYHCYLLDQNDLDLLEELKVILDDKQIFTPNFQQFLQALTEPSQLNSAKLQRNQGYFTLFSQPIDISSVLSPLWPQQPFVLIGGFLDQTKEANLYKEAVGLTNQEIVSLKFTPNRQNEYIRLYLPEKIPLPNTPQFQSVLTAEINHLIHLCYPLSHPIVILVEDLPLQTQLGTSLAAQWGTIVQIERELPENKGILVCSWQFWHQYSETCLSPQLLIMTTLPLPSLENPLVAGQVAYYKQQHKDWFRSYLLPTALKKLQQAVMPLRETQGLVALFDNRANLRSYGPKVLEALEPYGKVSYFDEDFLKYR